MLRRQIASVGCIKGPLSMALIRKLSVDDFQRLSLATEMYDMAVAASLTQERGRVAAVPE
ncbi:Mu-like prophage FluMu protein gp41 [Escherichia coli]|nr:Mu-like prophage FluMu protein gp41 [Escherichia coli]STE21685.1 Mu-like prophage FluMu protein gp41 [Escherichia coli]